MTDKLIADATRIAAGDDGTRYRGLEIALHWLTALLVATNYLLAEIWGYLPGRDPFRHRMEDTHVALGLLLTLVLALRILYRVSRGSRLPATRPGPLHGAARSVHYVLYLLLAVEVGLGIFYRWAKHDPLSFFGLVTFPAPWDFTRDQAHRIGDVHEWLANVIMILAGLHALAALFHHYVLRDDVLLRMMPRGRAR